MFPSEITMLEDGRVLTGSDWIKPEHYIDDDVASGRLVSLKGCTPSEWPGLDAEPAGPSEGDTRARFSTHSLPRPLAVRPSDQETHTV